MLLLVVLFLTFLPKKTLAQTPTTTPYPTPLPISYTASVSATMPDIVPPSIPILIAPSNGQLLPVSRPQFVWQKSIDNVELSHYLLTIDGVLAIDNISTVGTYTLYDLSYNASLGYYYLDLKYDLAQGSHTWKITAVDTVDNSSDSATWSFSVDSIAPSFVITDIGSRSVSISAQDSNTIPYDPIELDANEPELKGSGEANSTVQLTVIIPNEANLYYEFEINSGGYWSQQLPILPRDEDIELQFAIIDLASHVSALEDVFITIPSDAIVIPPTTSTPLPSPTPTLAPGEPTYTPAPALVVTPAASPTPEGQIRIPIQPPKEIVHFVLKKLPTPILKISRTPYFQLWLRVIGPWLVVLLVALPHLAGTLLLAKQFGSSLSFTILSKIWKAIGTWPVLNRQGWAFDSRLVLAQAEKDNANQEAKPGTSFEAKQGIPFAELNILGEPAVAGLPPLLKTKLTDKDGLYLPCDLPPNEYRLSLSHPDYRYPSQQQKPTYTLAQDFYQAERLKLTPHNLSYSLQIPADPDLSYSLNKSYQRLSWLSKLKVKIADIIHYQSWWNLLILILASLILLFYPNWPNWLAFGLYTILGIFYRQKEGLLGNIKGKVVDRQGDPLPNTLVRVKKTDDTGRTLATLTSQNGRFYFYAVAGDLEISAYKLGWQEIILPQQEQKLEVDYWWQQTNVVLMMEKV